MTTPETESAVGTTTPAAKYNYAIGYLRAFVVVLVVAHHAVLAYHPFAPPPPASLAAQPRWWQAFPVVDPQRWSGATLLAGFNDVFFMSLMFFLSGLFVWHGLQGKGAANFLRGRLLRLGVPFVLSAALLAPLAYYPSYLQLPTHTGFWTQWLALGQWPAGPAWFIWVLLAFDTIATLLFLAAPRWGESLGRRLPARPVTLFLALLAATALVYIPLAVRFSPMMWSAFGPFTFQTSRILHYLVYFLLGIGVGAFGVERGLFAPDGKLARRWPLWVASAVVLFGLAAAVTIVAVTSQLQSLAWAVAMDAGFVISCGASCFAFLAVFLRFARSRSSWFDSLSANSYGIYLVHYAFVSWLQYALLPAALPGAAKFAIVLLGAVGLSWGTTAVLRRSSTVRRVV
ncbi:acyltransferase [uncultured Paludibaculum sp.]|uniref:acyltransferase family protein n=1 Tax=uncultured Paludibaculum sp. TaxID=1765020 RepID=UPI002AAB98FE|nr:acyltransferase [uncultured Paludibaculum sp.]